MEDSDRLLEISIFLKDIKGNSFSKELAKVVEDIASRLQRKEVLIRNFEKAFESHENKTMF